jgi:bacterial/archaeal transporter family-2 protein
VERWLAVIGMATAGAIVALQPALNAGLGQATGHITAAMISFFIGAAALTVLVGVTGQLGQVSGITDARWYYLLGGLCGAVWVTAALIAVTTIGAGGVVAATITGQLTGAVVADRLGILGLEQTSISPERVLGVFLLLAGTYLVVR